MIGAQHWQEGSGKWEEGRQGRSEQVCNYRVGEVLSQLESCIPAAPNVIGQNRHAEMLPRMFGALRCVQPSVMTPAQRTVFGEAHARMGLFRHSSLWVIF